MGEDERSTGAHAGDEGHPVGDGVATAMGIALIVIVVAVVFLALIG